MMLLRPIASLLALTVSVNALATPSTNNGRIKASIIVDRNDSNDSHPNNLQGGVTNGMTRRGLFSNVVAKGMGAVTAASVVSSLSSISLLATTPQAAVASVPETGVKAPPFDLPNSRGEGTTSLNDLVKSGKWTVLYFYPGAFTSGCTLEARYFQRDIDQYRQLNAQIVGVSVDPVEKNAQFCNAENLDFFMLSDQGGRVSKEYGSALSIPGFGTFSNRQTYLIDPKGNLRWIFSDVESHIPRHSEEVLAKLKDLEAEGLTA